MLASLAAGPWRRGSAGSVTRRGSAGVPAGAGGSTERGSAAVPGPDWAGIDSISASFGVGGSTGVPAFFTGLAAGEGEEEDLAASLRRQRFSPDPRTGVKPSRGGGAGGEGAVGKSAAVGLMAAGGVPVVFTGMGAGGGASGGDPPWACGVVSGVFRDCMVAGGVSVGLVLKLLKIFVLFSTRGFSTS